MFKVLFPLILSLLSSVAVASELLNYLNSQYIIQDSASGAIGVPNIPVRTSYRTHYVKLYKVCREGNEIRTLAPIRTCVRYEQAPSLSNPIANCSGTNCNQRTCIEEALDYARAELSFPREVCAAYWDPESTQWRRRESSQKFRTDYPNCSVFKEIKLNRRTQWTFNIVKKVPKSHPRYERQYQGELLKRIHYEIPYCQ